MTIFNPLSQRILVTDTGTLRPKYSVRASRMLALALSGMGFMNITIATVAPLDTRTLWYNKDTDTLRRFNPITSSWDDLTRTGWFMHILQIAFRNAAVEGVMSDADKVMFFDVSADEPKTISVSDFKATLGVSGWVPWGDTITLSAAQSVINFAELPERFTNVFFIADYTGAEISPTTKTPRVAVKGVYPTGATFDLFFPGAAGFSGNTPLVLAQQLSGDRNDLTGFINTDWLVAASRTLWETEMHWSSAPVAGGYPLRAPTTQRLKSIRLMVIDDPVNEGGNPLPTYGFAPGSTFKQFVR